jgi:hypothetical protein
METNRALKNVGFADVGKAPGNGLRRLGRLIHIPCRRFSGLSLGYVVCVLHRLHGMRHWVLQRRANEWVVFHACN